MESRSSSVQTYKANGYVREVKWDDRDGIHVRVIGRTEAQAEQPGAPDDVAAMVEVGHTVPAPEGAHPGDRHILAEAAYLNPEQAIEAGLLLLESAAQAVADAHPYDGPVNRMTDDQRWRAHVIACGLQDSTFWVHKDQRWPNHYYAVEVETGTGAWGDTAQEAVANYFAGDHEWPHEPVRDV